mmetsp:Transcript_18610/g.31201  ORF Transcript_18610/g.31201 Transcript_18610/m.31201 type:complete len:275 (+) Transcript_18610:157-981(+)
MNHVLFILICVILCAEGIIADLDFEENVHHRLHEHVHIEDLERLAFKYGTDKSKDDHSYVDVYATLFQPRRVSIKKMVEIGVAAGQSLQMWHEYFPNAQIYGVDILRPQPNVQKNLDQLERAHVLIGDSTKPDNVVKFGFEEESIDLIIDDGNHASMKQEATLSALWKYLRPGGHYIMEDVDAQQGGFDFSENPHWLSPSTVKIFNDNHPMFIDAHVGHRAWDQWLKVATPVSAKDHKIHNSYLVVIRKRVGEVPPIHINSGEVAMKPEKVVGN